MRETIDDLNGRTISSVEIDIGVVIIKFTDGTLVRVEGYAFDFEPGAIILAIPGQERKAK